jgi:LruC domain-containing protein
MNKHNNIMKKLFLAFLLAGVQYVNAQTMLPTLTAESGNRSIEQANCWFFGAAGYTNSSTLVIAGSWSIQSNSPSNPDRNACWIKTPWIKPGSANITLKYKNQSATGGTRRMIVLSYISYNPNALNGSKEGTRVEFDSAVYTSPFPTTVQNLSFQMPAAIANSNQPYKIMVSILGLGGSTSSRLIVDDIYVDGVYFADPTNSCLPQSQIQDADGDGVADNDDAYPNDNTRAYNNFYPATGYGTLMFEDLWPATGDYDFNDVVVDYRYNRVTNAQNNIVEIKYTFVARATGASFKNGFAFQLDNIPAGRITGVTGTKTHGAPWLSNAANGTDNGQTNANIIVFDDMYKVLSFTGGEGINVLLNQTHSPEDTINVTVSFNTSVENATPLSALTHTNFNPYIIVNQVRGHEVHLPNKAPSAKADNSLFNTAQDATNLASNRSYVTANNLPWGLDVAQSIPHTLSKIDFISAYLKFASWAQSNGTTDTDWYLNNSTYRDNTKLYIRP